MYESEYNEKGGFYMMPRQLFSEKCPLSLEAKVLYTLLIDRTNLSLKNDFCDKNGKIFVYFTADAAAKILGCSSKKANRLFIELEHYTYIHRKKQGLGKPCLIYLNRLMLPSFTRPDETSFESEQKGMSRPDVLSCLDMPNIPSNYTNYYLN